MILLLPRVFAPSQSSPIAPPSAHPVRSGLQQTPRTTPIETTPQQQQNIDAAGNDQGAAQVAAKQWSAKLAKHLMPHIAIIDAR